MGAAVRNRKWLRAAFEGAVLEAMQAGKGDRNAALHRAACRCIELANSGDEVSHGEVRDRLLEAAGAAGLPKREAMAVLRSARRHVGDQDVRHQLPADERATGNVSSEPAPLDVEELFADHLRASADRPQTAGRRIPHDELAAVWDMARPCSTPELANLSGKPRPGIDGDRIADMDLARTLPRSASVPDWGGWWIGAGYRVLVRMIDARGRFAGLRARALGVPLDGRPKEVAPRGFAAGGLVLACPLAERMLRRDRDALDLVLRVGLVLVEGTPAFLSWASSYSEADEDAPAVVGYLGGGWTQEHADAVPSATRVVIDPDDNEAGRRLMNRLLDSLGTRVRLEVTDDGGRACAR
jgi:hypothetical protein